MTLGIVDIRPALTTDVTAIQTIEQAAAALFPPGRLLPNDQPVAIKFLCQAIHAQMLWVLTVDAIVAGFALASQHDNRLHLEELDVHPNHTRNGYGSALVNHVLRVAQQGDYEAVTLTTFADLPFNAAFYAQLGFVQVTRETSHSLLDSILIKEKLLGLSNRIGMIKPIT